MAPSRRTFLAGSLALALRPAGVAATTPRRPDRDADWADVWQEWAATPGRTNLESGGVQPVASAVDEHFRAAWDSAIRFPPEALAREQVPALERVRAALARASGFAPEEVALVRNTTEGLQNLLLGWPLRPGDRVLTTTQDYWRFQDGLDQRAAREGMVIDRIRIPVPLADDAIVVERFEAAVRPATRLVLLSEVVNLTGQILPVAAITAAMRGRGVAVLVDGAHGFGHLPGEPAALGADGYATSLHKWLGAPHGTGLLGLRRPWIEQVWPLFPSPAARRADIRKFEGVGTHPAAAFLAVPTALERWRRIGPEAKLARLRWLRDAWLDRFREFEGVRPLTRTAGNGAGALATLQCGDRDPRALADRLRLEAGIYVRPILHPEFRGLRVTPNLFNTTADLERFSLLLARLLGRAG